MPLQVGTTTGLFTTPENNLEKAEKTLDCGTVNRICEFDSYSGISVASDEGLYHTEDGGDSWTTLDVPQQPVVSILGGPDGAKLYAGTRPAAIYISHDGGTTWKQCEGFERLPSKKDWLGFGPVDEQVRTLATHPTTPNRIMAGVESAGVYVSDDRGSTWTERRIGVNDDVHHLLCLNSESYVASCGQGLYRTDDVGRTWNCLDTHLEQFWHFYHREAITYEGQLYTAALDTARAKYTDEVDGQIVVSDDRGQTIGEIHPQDSDYVLSWAIAEDHVLGGTRNGRILTSEESWGAVSGEVPGRIKSLLYI